MASRPSPPKFPAAALIHVWLPVLANVDVANRLKLDVAPSHRYAPTVYRAPSVTLRPATSSSPGTPSRSPAASAFQGYSGRLPRFAVRYWLHVSDDPSSKKRRNTKYAPLFFTSAISCPPTPSKFPTATSTQSELVGLPTANVDFTRRSQSSSTSMMNTSGTPDAVTFRTAT